MQIQIEPCLVVDGKKISENTIAEHFAKIDEELNELKEAITCCLEGWSKEYRSLADADSEDVEIITEEAIDTITAITSMINALGIDQDHVESMCKAVIEKNRKRGRLG